MVVIKKDDKTKVKKEKVSKIVSEPKKLDDGLLRKMTIKEEKSNRASDMKKLADRTKVMPYHLMGYESNGFKVIGLMPSIQNEGVYVTFECCNCGKSVSLLVSKNKARNLKCDNCKSSAKIVGVMEKRDKGEFESFYIISNAMYRALYKKCTNEETRMADIADLVKKLRH